MTLPTILRDALAETYADVSEVIDKVVLAFVRKYGGDYHDLRADANMLFMEAFRGFDPDRSSFRTWVQFRVSKGLLEQLRKQMVRSNLSRRVNLDVSRMQAREQKTFDLEEFTEQLSADAVVIARLVLRTPQPIAAKMLDGKTKANEMADLIMERVLDVVLQSGWTLSRVMRAVSELRAVVI